MKLLLGGKKMKKIKEMKHLENDYRNYVKRFGCFKKESLKVEMASRFWELIKSILYSQKVDQITL